MENIEKNNIECQISDTEKMANEVYKQLNIDQKTFPSLEELGANYQKQMIDMQRESIEKSSYSLCK